MLATLEDRLGALAVSAVVGGAFLYAMNHHPYQAQASLKSVDALVNQEARAVASSGDGATITFVPNGPMVRVEIHRSRPTSTSTVDSTIAGNPVTIEGTLSMRSDGGTSDGSVPYSVFLSRKGQASASLWALGSAPLASEPPCTNPIVLTLLADGAQQQLTIPCDATTIATPDPATY